MRPSIATTLTATSIAVLLTAVGCGDQSAPKTSSSSSSSSSSTKSVSSSASPSSSSAAEQDYSALLITAEDIVGETFTAQEPTVNPGGHPGAATVFSNADDTREIGDTILVLPDADAAGLAFQGAQAALSGSVAGGTPESANVGSDSVVVSGTSPDGSKAVTIVLFVQDTAFTTLEFDSAAGDPLPPEAAIEIATKQDEKIKSAL